MKKNSPELLKRNEALASVACTALSYVELLELQPLLLEERDGGPGGAQRGNILLCSRAQFKSVGPGQPLLSKFRKRGQGQLWSSLFMGKAWVLLNCSLFKRQTTTHENCDEIISIVNCRIVWIELCKTVTVSTLCSQWVNLLNSLNCIPQAWSKLKAALQYTKYLLATKSQKQRCNVIGLFTGILDQIYVQDSRYVNVHCLLLLYFQTNKSFTTVRGPSLQPEVLAV